MWSVEEGVLEILLNVESQPSKQEKSTGEESSNVERKRDSGEGPGPWGRARSAGKGEALLFSSGRGAGSEEDARGIPALARLPESVASRHHSGKRGEGAQLALPILPAWCSSSANLGQSSRHTQKESVSTSSSVSKLFQGGSRVSECG